MNFVEAVQYQHLFAADRESHGHLRKFVEIVGKQVSDPVCRIRVLSMMERYLVISEVLDLESHHDGHLSERSLYLEARKTPSPWIPQIHLLVHAGHPGLQADGQSLNQDHRSGNREVEYAVDRAHIYLIAVVVTCLESDPRLGPNTAVQTLRVLR